MHNNRDSKEQTISENNSLNSKLLHAYIKKRIKVIEAKRGGKQRPLQMVFSNLQTIIMQTFIKGPSRPYRSLIK